MAVFPSNLVFKHSFNSFSALNDHWVYTQEDLPAFGELFVSAPRNNPNYVSLLSRTVDNKGRSVLGNFTDIVTNGIYSPPFFPTGRFLVYEEDQDAWLPRSGTPSNEFYPLTAAKLATTGPIELSSSQTTAEILPWGVAKVYGGYDITPLGNFASDKYVFVIDSGCARQPNLDFIDEWSVSFVSGQGPFQDGDGHGSHVSGTIAGKVGGGPIGVAPGAKVIVVKCFADEGGGATSATIIAGVNHCRSIIEENDLPLEDVVINMSLGGAANSTDDDPLSAAVRSTAAAGIRIAVAAGNDGRDVDKISPAQAGDHPNVWTVAASDIYDVQASFSNYDELTGPNDVSDIQYSAPGVDILSWNGSPGYLQTLNGTSMACPHVAGLLLVGDIKDGPTQTSPYSNRPDLPMSESAVVPFNSAGESLFPEVYPGFDGGSYGGGTLLVDGKNVKPGDRVLVKNQEDAVENGVYLAADGPWVRTDDTIQTYTALVVEKGNTNAETEWFVSTYGNIVLDVTEIKWSEFAIGFPFDLSGQVVENFINVEYVPPGSNVDGSALVWDGTKWTNGPGFFDGGNAELDDFDGVVFTDPVEDGSLMVWDSSAQVWKNEVPEPVTLASMEETVDPWPGALDQNALGYFEETGKWGPKNVDNTSGVIIINDGDNDTNPDSTSEIVTGEVKKIVPFDAEANPVYGRRHYGTLTSRTPYAGVYAFAETRLGSGGGNSDDLEQFVPWGVLAVYDGFDITPLGDCGAGKYIFVIDSGCYPHPNLTIHPDWSTSLVPGIPDFYNDTSGHGTHVAGTAAGGVGGGPIGVAPGATIIVVKIFDYGGAPPERTIAAVAYCRDVIEQNNLPLEDVVINMSLGGQTSFVEDPVSAAVRSAAATGIKFAIAAGNSSMDVDMVTPAQAGDHPNVWTVAASDRYGNLAYFTNYDNLDSGNDVNDVQYAAPGVDITSWGTPGTTSTGTKFKDLDGTSMACPHVAGLLAVGDIVEGAMQISLYPSRVPDYPLALNDVLPPANPTAPVVRVYAEVRGKDFTPTFWSKFPDGAFYFRGIYDASINLERESMEGFFPNRTTESFSFQFWFRLDSDANEFQNRLFFGFGCSVTLGRSEGDKYFTPTPWQFFDSSNQFGDQDDRGGSIDELDPATADLILRFDPISGGNYAAKKYFVYGKVYKERDHHLMVSFDTEKKEMRIFLDGQLVNANGDITFPGLGDPAMRWRDDYPWVIGGAADTGRGYRNMALRGYVADLVIKNGQGSVQSENFVPPSSFGRKLISPPKAALGVLGVSKKGIFAWSAQQTPNVWNVAMQRNVNFIRDENLIGKTADYDVFTTPVMAPGGFTGQRFQLRVEPVPINPVIPEIKLASWYPTGPEGYGSQTAYLSQEVFNTHVPRRIQSKEIFGVGNNNDLYIDDHFGSLFVTYNEPDFPQGCIQLVNSERGFDLTIGQNIDAEVDYGDRIGQPGHYGVSWFPTTNEIDSRYKSSYTVANAAGFAVYVSSATGVPTIYIRLEFDFEDWILDGEDFNYAEGGAKRTLSVDTGVVATLNEKHEINVVYDNAVGFLFYYNGRRLSIRQFSPDGLDFGDYDNIGLPQVIAAPGRHVINNGFQYVANNMTGLMGPGYVATGALPPNWPGSRAQPSTFDFSPAFYRSGNPGEPTFFSYGSYGVIQSIAGDLNNRNETPVSPDGIAFIGSSKQISGQLDFMDTDLDRNSRTQVLGWRDQRSFSQYPVEGYFEGIDVAGYNNDYYVLTPASDPTQLTYSDTRGSSAGREGGELIVYNDSDKTFSAIVYDPEAGQDLGAGEAVGTKTDGDFLYWNERLQAWQNDQLRTEIEWNLVDLIDVNPEGRIDSGQDSGSGGSFVPWGVRAVYSGLNVANVGDVGEGKYAFVIDSGCLPLSDFKFARSWSIDLSTDGDPFIDLNGHGTHVTGSLAAKSSGSGLVGVAPGATVVVVKVFDSSGRANNGTIIAAVNYCRSIIEDNNLPLEDCVVNMSLGGPVGVVEGIPLEGPTSAAVRSAASAGIRFAVAAGNSGDSTAFYAPAQAGDHPNVWAVAACGEDGQMPVWSNYDSSTAIDINDNIQYAAPGVNVISYYQGGQLASLNGTSMASPHLAGLLLMGGIVPGPIQTSPYAFAAGQPISLAADVPTLDDIPTVDTEDALFEPPAKRKEAPKGNSVLVYNASTNGWFTKTPEETSSLSGLSDVVFPEFISANSLLHYDLREDKWVVRDSEQVQFIEDLQDVDLEFRMYPSDLGFFLVYRGGRWMEVSEEAEKWGSGLEGGNSPGEGWRYGGDEIHDFLPNQFDFLSNYGGTLTKGMHEQFYHPSYYWTRNSTAKVGHGDGGDFEAGECLFGFVFGVNGGGNFETGAGDSPVELVDASAVDGGDFDIFKEYPITGEVVIDTFGDEGSLGGSQGTDYVPVDKYITWTKVRGQVTSTRRGQVNILRFQPRNGISDRSRDNEIYCIKCENLDPEVYTGWSGLTTPMTEQMNLLDNDFTIETWLRPELSLTPIPPEMCVLAGGAVVDPSDPEAGKAWRLSVTASRDDFHSNNVVDRVNTYKEPRPSQLIWDMWDDNDVRHRYVWELPRNFWQVDWRQGSLGGNGRKFPGDDVFAEPEYGHDTPHSNLRHFVIQRNTKKGILSMWLDEMRYDFVDENVNTSIKNVYAENESQVTIGMPAVRLGRNKADSFGGSLLGIKMVAGQAVYPSVRERLRRHPEYSYSAN